MQTNTTELVTTMSYLLGVREDQMERCYGSENGELIKKLREDKAASIIRYLCKIRTMLWIKYKAVDHALRYDLKNLDMLEWFDSKEIYKLEEWGIHVLQSNRPIDKYILEVNNHINNRIANCEHLFYDWQRFDYIKELFKIPRFTDQRALKKEFNKYAANLNCYPYQLYIHWEPEERGNILYNDGAFLKMLFAQHGQPFDDRSKFRDATADTKNKIYKFIEDAGKIMIVVDCENSDVYKLVSVIRNLDQESLSKIEKIRLYDDIHTASGWDYLATATKIPVEHIEVDRLKEEKSLVDMRMASGICTAHYREGITSFILLSSDSDFWGLISSQPSMEFMVFYEYDKCSPRMREALEEHEYYYCSIDDFYSGNTEGFKKKVSSSSILAQLPDVSELNALEMARKAYLEARINVSESEFNNYFRKKVKNIHLKIEDNGKMHWEMGD